MKKLLSGNKHQLKSAIFFFLFIILSFFSCKTNENQNPISLLFSQPSPFIISGKQFQLSSFDLTGGNNDRIPIKANEKIQIADIKGEGLISRIWVTIDSRDPDYLRKILIRMYWDDESHPSVEVPIGDFFGSPFQYKHHLPKYLGMSSGGFYSYFPMAFKYGARIEIENQSEEEVYAFYYQINYYSLDKGSMPDEMPYFHAYWNRDIRTDYPENYIALEAEGKGFFVGLNFNGQPYDGRLFYLEGDEMIYVDGETAPSIHGTGLEDYFTSGWYFKDGEFSASFHGLTLLDQGTGRVTAYRHHIPDAIPFNKSIQVSLEHGHGNKEVIDLSTTSFWYQSEPHQVFPEILSAGQRMPLRRPLPHGIIKPTAIQTSGELREILEDRSEFGSDWIDNKQLLVEGMKGESFSITLDQLDEEAYNVSFFVSEGPGFGKIKVKHGGKELLFFDGKSKDLMPLEKIDLGELQPKDGKLVLDIQFMESGFFGMDGLLISPKRKFLTDWFMIGPFPNLRKTDYDRPGLDSAFFPEKSIDLNFSYPGFYGQDLKWFRVNEGKSGYDMRLWQYFNPREFIVIYALSYVFSPKKETYKMYVGCDDTAKIFINDKEVYRFFDLMRIAAPDQDMIEVELEEGWNKVLVKAENNFGGFAFYLRFADPSHNLFYSADKTIK
jgi:hypothetical protein